MSLPIILFSASAAFLLYVLMGYPAALALWSSFSRRPIRKQFIARKISIIIPVRNGAKWIDAKLRSLLDSDYPAHLLQILVISDGSIDGTDELVSAHANSCVTLVSLPAGGKAAAINRGLERASSDIIVLTDVRQPFASDALRLLVACFADASVGVVTGELVIREGNTREEFNTGLYWKYEKWIRKNLNRVDAMLGATGSICAVRREALGPIPPDILLDDVYIPLVAVSRGFRIYFEDHAKAYDLPTSLHSEFRRKVRTQAGVYQVMRYFPWLLWPGNRRFIHFVSHKFGRLLLPFALILMFATSFGLPEPWRIIALVAQSAFYFAALLDPMLGEGSPLKRATGVVRAFVVLVAAAFCALAVFILPAQQLWRETKVEAARETGGSH